MKIIIEGIEPQFKVYKMTESIYNRFYIGRTKQCLKDRMNGHRYARRDCIQADYHFGEVGWQNVTVEILDVAKDEEELIKKEEEEIIKNTSPLMLNRVFNQLDDQTMIQREPRIKKEKKDKKQTITVNTVIGVWSDEENKWDVKHIEYEQII